MSASKTDGTDCQTQELIDTLRSDFAALKSDIDKIKQDSIAVGKVTANSAGAYVENEVEKAARKAGAAANDTAEKTSELADDIKAQVQQKPLTSVSAAMALGVLIGRTFAKRS